MEKEKSKWIVVAFLVSFVLLFVKFYSYSLTNSTAILTDALESIVNVVAAGFASYSIYLSSRPKDDNHPYGHGKIEFFSAGVEGTLIILAGIFIIFQAINNFFDPQELDQLPIGIALIGISGLINGMLGFVLQKKGVELKSLTIEASGKHLMTDAITSLVLILGVAIIYFTSLYYLDSVISILFSLYIIYSGYALVRRSVGGLMDEADPSSVEAIVGLLNKTRKPNWIDIHNLRVQQYGSDRHIDLHLTLPYYLDLNQVHDEVQGVEKVLEEDWPGMMEVFIHADPCIPENCCQYCQLTACPVRKAPITVKIEWTVANMSKNQKHYHDSV
ncbi:cation diffusion facilitator family transporter [Rhodonellum sp.]|uniref:cation diffusion facilitator family transporter n=1 Tax=Rhodonellum sp. TaxID=2231180 RepID=UPI002718F580|nr:cation diffusion facilitator family transporter [Rhodonellum sp.]MDO9553177.1 cation diffusion facilitator family transporter [Rhodonellum sp.]